MNEKELLKEVEETGCEITMKRVNGCTEVKLGGAGIAITPLIASSLCGMGENGVLTDSDLLFIANRIYEFLGYKNPKSKGVA